MKTFLEIFLDFPIFSAAFFIGAEANDSPRDAASDTKSSAFSTGGLAAAIYAARPSAANITVNTCTEPSPGPMPKAKSINAADRAKSASSTAPALAPVLRRRARNTS